MIEKIVVYKNFYKAGTTALLKNVFKDPKAYGVDSEFINVRNEDVSIFEFTLNNAVVQKHKQMKINSDLAFIVSIQNEEHYFIISQSSGLIIDLTANLNYKIKKDEIKESIKGFVLKYQ